MVPLAQLLDRRPGCSATLLTAAHCLPCAASRYATTSRPRKPFRVAVHTHVSANCSHDDSNSLVPLVGRWSLGATNDGQLTIIDRCNSRASRAAEQPSCGGPFLRGWQRWLVVAVSRQFKIDERPTNDSKL